MPALIGLIGRGLLRFGAIGIRFAGRTLAGAIRSVTWIIPALLSKLLGAVANSHIWAILWAVGIRIGLLALVYEYFTDLILYRLAPLMTGALNALPSMFTAPMYRICQFGLATNYLIPWEDILLAVKWIVLVKLFILSWHLIDWVIEKALKITYWKTSA